MANTRTKLVVIASSLMMCSGVFAIRSQYTPILGISMASLLLLTIKERSPIPMFGLAGLATLLQSGGQFTRLAATDVHSAALIASEISTGGWPVGDLSIAWGFPGTPLLHFHAVALSNIIDLEILPKTLSEPLSSALLPPVYVLASLGLTVVMARRLDGSPTVAGVVLILWLPFFEWAATFRRQAMGFAIFATIVALLVFYKLEHDRRFVIPLGLSFIAAAIAHHMSVVIIGIYLAVLSASQIIRFDEGLIPKLSPFKAPKLLLLFGSVSIVWYLFSTGSASEIVLLIYGFASLLTAASSGVSVGGIERGLYLTYQLFLSRWVFQTIVATGVITAAAYAVLNYRIVDIERQQLAMTVTLFGVVIGGLSAVGLFFGGLDGNRLMTYFLLGGGAALATAGWRRVEFDVPVPAQKVALALIVLVGVSMIPAHLVTGQPPAYDQGVDDDQNTEQTYRTAFWIQDYYQDETIFGDIKTREVVTPIGDVAVESGIGTLLNGETPTGTFVFRDSNGIKYSGWVYGSTTRVVTIRTQNLHQSLELRNEIYANGQSSIYQSGNSTNPT